MSGIIIKAFKSGDVIHEMHVFTKEGDFIASSNLKEAGNGFLEVDGPCSRRGFGKYLYDFLAMYAHKEGKSIISAMDGDTRSGAIRNWERIFNDSKFEKKEIPEEMRYGILEDFTKEEVPFLFVGSSLKPDKVYEESILDNDDVSHFLRFHELKDKYKEVFGITYDNDCNKWIDEEYPVNKKELIDRLEGKVKIENKRKMIRLLLIFFII